MPGGHSTASGAARLPLWGAHQVLLRGTGRGCRCRAGALCQLLFWGDKALEVLIQLMLQQGDIGCTHVTGG